MLAQQLGIPAYVKVHGSDVNIIANIPSVRRQIIGWGKQVAAVAAVSTDLSKKLQKIGIPASKIRTIYNGIDHKIFYPLPPGQARNMLPATASQNILFVGNLKKEKGCMDLLESFVQLSLRYPELKLYFAGTGTMLPIMKKRCVEAQLQNRVQFLGKVKHATLNYWYNAASVVSLPSYNEGVPNVLLEAMACGTPVVATNVGGIPEIMTDNTGILTPVNDIQTLTEKLDEALQKDWDHHTINRHAQQFSWEKNIQQMLDIFGCSNSMERRS